ALAAVLESVRACFGQLDAQTARHTRCVPSAACNRTRVDPSSVAQSPGRSRIHPNSAGGLGRGECEDFLPVHPHPNPAPQAPARKRTKSHKRATEVTRPTVSGRAME